MKLTFLGTASGMPDLNHLNGLAANASVLISEGMHISFGAIIEFAKAHGISKTIITHIPPAARPLDGALGERDSGLEVRFANDGDTIEA